MGSKNSDIPNSTPFFFRRTTSAPQELICIAEFLIQFSNRLFNSCVLGGFAIYHVPGYKVYIDDRVELFGEEGANNRPAKIGVFERAHGGTLYLDEAADMPRETQGRILRVLVEQRFRRVGGDQDVQVDVRVISSTSKDLREEISAGRFREDLFHRLNVVPVNVPGLSERREDIPELIEDFIERICEAVVSVTPDLVAAAQQHPGFRETGKRMLRCAERWFRHSRQ